MNWGMEDLQSSALPLGYAARKMAGVAGFEPTSGDSKDRCLTAWLHPIVFGGGGRIRTYEGVYRQIYSLLPLAARELLRKMVTPPGFEPGLPP